MFFDRMRLLGWGNVLAIAVIVLVPPHTHEKPQSERLHVFVVNNPFCVCCFDCYPGLKSVSGAFCCENAAYMFSLRHLSDGSCCHCRQR